MVKKKITYVGHFHEGNSGWCRAATDLALACDFVGIDIVCRSIKLDNNIDPHPRIKQLMSKDTSGSTHVVQHVLPHFYEYNSSAGKNIGYFVGEGSEFSKNGWEYRASLLDEVWVPNRELKSRLNTNKPIHVVHHAHNISLYQKRLTPIINTNRYVFYTIVDLVNRKNLEGLLKAYHCEFGTSENVMLLIKANKSGLSPEQLSSEVQRINQNVINQIRKYKDDQQYLEVHVINERISDEDMHRIHTSGDCYVSLSHGEAWNYPLADAIFHGNECVASMVEGHKEYVPLSSGILVNGIYEPALGFDSLPNYQTCHGDWFVPLINEARKSMRQKFNESQKTPGFIELREKRSQKNRELVNEFSYYRVGERIKELCK